MLCRTGNDDDLPREVRYVFDRPLGLRRETLVHESKNVAHGSVQVMDEKQLVSRMSCRLLVHILSPVRTLCGSLHAICWHDKRTIQCVAVVSSSTGGAGCHMR